MAHSTRAGSSVDQFSLSESDLDRFWSKVDRGADDACWNWVAAKMPRGYGIFHYGGASRTAYAHRISDFLARGPIPRGICVCHHCDNPACVNPRHLFRGTIADNNADRDRKGRGRGRHKSSEMRERADGFVAAYSEGLSLRHIGRMYGVDKTTVRETLKKLGVYRKTTGESKESSNADTTLDRGGAE